MADRRQHHQSWITAFSSDVRVAGEPLFADAQPRQRRHRTVGWVSTGLLPAAHRSATALGTGQRLRAIPAKQRTVGHREDSRHVLSQELFRDVLAREWKRADRCDRAVSLLLVSVNESDAGQRVSLWTRTLEALITTAPDTAVIGWFARPAVLGVIVSDGGAADQVDAASLETRARQELASRLEAQELPKVSLHLQAYAPVDSGEYQGSAPEPRLLRFSDREASHRVRIRYATKRALDVAGSLALLLVLAPVFLVVAILVKWKSPGPVFFRQVRVGQSAKPFTMLKFRTMHVDADHALHRAYVTSFITSGSAQAQPETEPVFKLVNDPRITPLGRVLRKTSLDELPQLWNVLRGDMSLVGPRPPLPYELEQYRRWHRRRVLEAKPGVTGLWQVTGRSQTTFDEMVRLDLRYVKTCSLWTDIKILLATPRAVFSGKGAC